MSQKLADLITEAPAWTPQMAGELGSLLERHVCVQAFFGKMASDGFLELQTLAETAVETEEGKGNALRLQGAIKARQVIVNNLLFEISQAANSQEEETPTVGPKRIRPKTPARKTSPAKKRTRK